MAEAWTRAGFNVHDCFKRACAVTNEWVYDVAGCGPLKSRISQRISHERSIPLKNRTLAEVLNPQVGPFSSFLFWLFCATVCSFSSYTKHKRSPAGCFSRDRAPVGLDRSRRCSIERRNGATVVHHYERRADLPGRGSAVVVALQGSASVESLSVFVLWCVLYLDKKGFKQSEMSF